MKRTSGFTLVELLVVIGIISALVLLGATNWVAQQQKARDARRKADLEQIRAALEMYRSAYNVHSYPYDPADLNQSYNELVTAIEGDTKYIKVIPVDPKSKNLYRYTPGVTGRTYTLSSNEMERETNPYNVYNP